MSATNRSTFPLKLTSGPMIFTGVKQAGMLQLNADGMLEQLALGSALHAI